MNFEAIYDRLSIRAKTVLDADKIESVDELLSQSPRYLRSLRHCGDATVREIVDSVAIEAGIMSLAPLRDHIESRLSIREIIERFAGPTRPVASTAPRCDTCRFWSRDEGDGCFGECRRHAPRPWKSETCDDFDDGPTVAFWPETANDDWCGEHEAKA